MAFDPDAYLAEPQEFDPDAYLGDTQEITTEALDSVSPPVAVEPQASGFDADVSRYMQEGMDERDAKLKAYEGRSLSEGIPDALKTIISGATTGSIGFMGGALEGILKNVKDGTYGTEEGADIVERLAMQRMGEFTRKSNTERGQEILGQIAEAVEPLESLPPVIPQAATFSAIPAQAARATIDRSSMPSIRASEMGFKSGDLSVGAAQSADDLVRAKTAAQMPVPFEGGSALTKGQATRNFEQLQFEKEIAKQGELGAPLRERVQNQTNTLISNLDALADQPGGVRTELRDIGLSIDDALIKRFDSEKMKVDKLYAEAREAGQLRDPVEISRIGLVLDDIAKFEDLSGVGGLVNGAKAYTKKNKIVDEDGNPLNVSIEDAERFRQWVNDATDLTDARQSRVRRVLISAIDDATEQAGGDLYRAARKARSNMAREFENVGITKKLLSTKKGTDERSIAYEDVFKKVFLDSPIEEINKLRGTLLRSGDDGKQAWADLKSKGVQYIKESAQSASQKDEAGNPIISPDKLNRVISQLDQKGKLESIYGKRNAQVIRDLGDIAIDLYTAPPGAINYSNTASALQVGLDMAGTFILTGGTLPAPVATTLIKGAQHIKDKKKKKRIIDSLNYLKGSGKDEEE
ncbi:MAG: hypothetical protein ACN2B6_00940 [Rickettsiales bacterium]